VAAAASAWRRYLARACINSGRTKRQPSKLNENGIMAAYINNEMKYRWAGMA